MTPFASESSLKSKNGYSRIIPLRARAMGVLKSLPKTEEEFTWQCLDSSGHDAGPLLFVCITQPFGSPRLLLLLGSDVPLVLRLQRLCLAPARDKECRCLTKVIVPTSSGLMKEPIGKSLRQPELPPKRQRLPSKLKANCSS